MNHQTIIFIYEHAIGGNADFAEMSAEVDEFLKTENLTADSAVRIINQELYK